MILKNRRKAYQIDCQHTALTLGQRTAVMGIVNATPDSFSRDGVYQHDKSVAQALRLARRMVKDGADVLDVGGESSRPGAAQVSLQEEKARVIPLIRAMVKAVDVPISVDTYKADVARAALDEGATIINNIKGCSLSSAMLKQVMRYDATLVLMHMKGIPATMQQRIHYHHVVVDVMEALQKTIAYCLDAGLKKNKIVIDPGIGFGKTVEHNLMLIQHLDQFKKLDCPILLGASRKSFIGQVLDCDVRQRLHGSLAVAGAAVIAGAHMLRVHDVKETRQAVNMMDAIINLKEEKQCR